MKTWMKWAIAAVVVVVLGVVGGPFVYINFIKDDPPDRFSLDDGAAATDVDDPGDDSRRARRRSRRPRRRSPASPPRRRRRRRRRPPTGPRGPSTPATSAVGYRVVEVLFGQDTEGVGRTSAITGGLTLDGAQVTAADFEVDMTTVTSDEDRRDNQFRGRLHGHRRTSRRQRSS